MSEALVSRGALHTSGLIRYLARNDPSEVDQQFATVANGAARPTYIQFQ